MSFFPSPDPQRLRDSLVQHNTTPYYQTPPASANPQSLLKQYTLPFSDNDHAFDATLQSTTWPEEPRGLGLVTFAEAMNSTLSTAATPALNANTHFTWPNDFTAGPSSTPSLANWRSPTLGSSCDPFATPLSTAAAWTPQLATTGDYHYSPNDSQHSASTHASSIPSPFAQTDGLPTMSHQPSIKLEDQSAYGAHQLHFIPEMGQAMQSLQVRPCDLIADTSYQSYGIISIAGSPEVEEDVKPMMMRRRPSYRRTQSTGSFSEGPIDGRPKRGFTKPETANCACDQCGKLFQRSYNLKAHLDTHAPNREHPHVCMYSECDKRFVRRTDLVRHEASVHLKERNFTCHLCDSAFARKDTLRRHIDDGCPKRTECRKRTTVKKRRSTSTLQSRRTSVQHTQDFSPIQSPLRYPVRYI
nr:hypothetical protein B0A51_01710 [Rachicladosporium sp. CCFEE 5018]